MKNFKLIALSLIFALAVPFAANAQVYQSKSYVKKTTVTKKVDNCKWKKFQGYIDAGIRIPTSSAYDDNGLKLNYTAGFELDLGFQLRMGCKGWYWGMSGSFFTSGLSTPDGNWYRDDYAAPLPIERKGGSSTIYGGQLNFTTFGWRTMLTEKVMLDINVGLAVDANSEGYLDDKGGIEQAYAGIGGFCVPIGIGVQINKIRINAKYQFRGAGDTHGWGFNQSGKEIWEEKGFNINGNDMWNSLRLTVGYAF